MFPGVVPDFAFRIAAALTAAGTGTVFVGKVFQDFPETIKIVMDIFAKKSPGPPLTLILSTRTPGGVSVHAARTNRSTIRSM
jgi:hypothetical protein